MNIYTDLWLQLISGRLLLFTGISDPDGIHSPAADADVGLEK